jgi:exonuclease SbcD
MAHTHLEGAMFGESERRVHIVEDWAASPKSLPRAASYVALGHLHRPQKVDVRVPAYYAGSPLQMDFGEAGEEKTFNVVTASPGGRAEVDLVPYEGGLALVDLRATLAELDASAERYRKGWLRVTVPLAAPDPDLNRRVRELLPNALVVRAELPEVEEPAESPLEAGLPPVGHYAAYHYRVHAQAAELAVLDTFQDLYDQAFGDDQVG